MEKVEEEAVMVLSHVPVLVVLSCHKSQQAGMATMSKYKQPHLAGR